MIRIGLFAFMLFAGALLPTATSAQDRPAPSPEASGACLPQEALQDDAGGPKGQDETDGANLSERLARTDGVICPPEIGPDIRLKPPETGTTPVIPPPDEPGQRPKQPE